MLTDQLLPILSSPHLSVGMVCSQFNPSLCQALEAKAREALAAAQVDQVQAVHVPGALETPIALQRMARSGHFDALIALGVIIRGETYHFELVAHESARGVTEVSLAHDIPIANAILTVEHEAQARERLNKGWDAVLVAINMVHALRAYQKLEPNPNP